MLVRPPAASPRCGVVDLGSNSVRLVIYEGASRNPTPIFNEKAVLRLGRGLQATGRLNQEGVEQALTVLHRYHAIARAMQAEPFEVLATAAVRDAENGAAFVERLRQRMPGVPIHILSGQEEAAYSTDGVLCGMPGAHGVLADIGGGSLEVVRLITGRRGASRTLPLGVIRLQERSGNDLLLARTIADADLQTVPWLAEAAGETLYLVGGAWRALARIHIAQVSHPLAMVHYYTISRDAARDLSGEIANATRKALERLSGAPRRRLDDLPYAATALRRLLRAVNPNRVVFSASGLREGWFMRHLPAAALAQDPLLSAAQELAARHGRDPALPPSLIAWTAPLCPNETEPQRRLREVLCWLSDVGSHDHPEFRAEQAFLRVLRQPSLAPDHQERAFLALGVALRYEAEASAPFLRPARVLLDAEAAQRAEILGIALRLAYTLSAGTDLILQGTALRIEGGWLVLRLRTDSGVFVGESVTRRLERLALALGLRARYDD
jgi:exopolyphosphatase/guanosine-5'-triphosphate,3'-diphosphate pyrophosphatase